MTTPIVSLTAVSALSDVERAEAAELGRAVYPPAEWANWPGRHIEWSPAEWCVRVWREDASATVRHLVSFVGIVLRHAEHDGAPVLIGGIGSVKTHPAARGRGYARLAIRGAVEFFRERPDVTFGLLVCDPPLIPYYARLGWKLFNGRLMVEQHGAIEEFTFDRVMTLDIHAPGPTSGTIDLKGPPW